MKNKTIILMLVLATTVSLLTLPLETKAKTIKQFEAEVNKYTEELNAVKSQMAKNDSDIAAIKKKIAVYEQQMTEAQNKIEQLQIEINESEKEIERKSEESKSIIEYYQIANGTNAYLEYAFGANDITDMIYRMSVVEQLTEYNDRVMKELEELIKNNKKKQEELSTKKVELTKLKDAAEFEKKRIQADSASLRDTVPSIETQIKEAQSQVKYYKSLGCGENEDIQACQYRIEQQSGNSLPSVGFFSRPMKKGYVVRGKSASHTGYDLSSYNKSEPIYPIATGSIHAIYTDACVGNSWCGNMGFRCNGNAKIVVVKHKYNNGYVYSSYVHLGSYANIKVGQFVTQDTLIGYMGNTGCSSGPHLHLEVATCFWKNNGGCTYANYTNRIFNPNTIINLPSSWNNR